MSSQNLQLLTPFPFVIFFLLSKVYVVNLTLRVHCFNLKLSRGFTLAKITVVLSSQLQRTEARTVFRQFFY